MSLTKRTYTDILENTLVATGSVTGASTKLTMSAFSMLPKAVISPSGPS